MGNDKEVEEKDEEFFSTRGWDPFRHCTPEFFAELCPDQSELPLETENEYLNRTILTRTRE